MRGKDQDMEDTKGRTGMEIAAAVPNSIFMYLLFVLPGFVGHLLFEPVGCSKRAYFQLEDSDN